MKLLKIENDKGHFLNENNEYTTIDRITKENLLWLIDQIIDNDTELDEYSQEKVKNEAHQILYESIYEKLKDFKERKSQFIDEAKRSFLTDYEKYRDDISQNGSD